MPQAGVSARARSRYAAPWWDELDREAFRFPAADAVRPAERMVAVPAEPTRPVLREASSTAGKAPGSGRTVAIRGHGAERSLPVARPTLRRHERPGFRPDRAALWAVILGLVLILVAVASAHGAVVH